MSETKHNNNEPYIGVGVVTIDQGLLLALNSSVEDDRPSQHNVVVGILTNNKKVKVISEKGIWYKVSYTKNAHDVVNAVVLYGYCKKDFIKITKRRKTKNEEVEQPSTSEEN